MSGLLRLPLAALTALLAGAVAVPADVLLTVQQRTEHPFPNLPPVVSEMRVYLGAEAARIESEGDNTVVLRYDSTTPITLRSEPPTRRSRNERGLNYASEVALRLQAMGESKELLEVACKRYSAKGSMPRLRLPMGGERMPTRRPDGQAMPETQVEAELWIGALPAVSAQQLAHVLVHEPRLSLMFPFTAEELGALPGIPLQAEFKRQELRGTSVRRLEVLSVKEVPADPARYATAPATQAGAES